MNSISYSIKSRSDEFCQANHFLGYYHFGKHEITDEVKSKIDAIRQEYLGGDIETFNDEVFKSISNAFSDSGFHYGTDKMAR